MEFFIHDPDINSPEYKYLKEQQELVQRYAGKDVTVTSRLGTYRVGGFSGGMAVVFLYRDGKATGQGYTVPWEDINIGGSDDKE